MTNARPLEITTDRSGNDALRAHDSRVSAARGGDVAGEHTVFYLVRERLELTHRATSPVIFAQGAVKAAAWLAAKDAWRLLNERCSRAWGRWMRGNLFLDLEGI